jgi:ribose transport system substrate-binding protein
MTWKSFSAESTTADATNVQDIELLHPQGVVLTAPTSLQFEQQRKSWMSSGVPVAEGDNPTADNNYYKDYTGIPSGASLQALGRLIAKEVGNSGSFAILGGQAGVSEYESTWKPIIPVLHKLVPNLQILPTQYDNFSTATATSIVSALLVAHPDLKGVYSISGPEGTGIITALKQAKKEGVVKVFSGSGDPDLVSDLRAGWVSGLLANSPYQIGWDDVHALITYLNSPSSIKKTVPHAKPQNVIIPAYLITKANLNAPAAKSYEYVTSCSS